MVSTIIPIWYNTLAADAGIDQAGYLATWSYATSAATIITAVLGPVTGAIADNEGYKKPMFTASLLVGAFCCALLGIVPQYMFYLCLYVVAKILYQLSLVYYDSMINDVTTADRMDDVSSIGYARGYLGSCIPFLAALALYYLGLIEVMPIRLSIFIDFVLIAVWWVGVTIPLLKNYKQTHYIKTDADKISASFKRLGSTITHMYHEEKKVFFFLIGFFFYIDGVYTIIDEAVAVGTALGLDQMGLLVILLLTQVVAFAFASLFGKLSQKYKSSSLITVCIVGYACIAFYALVMKELWQFGIMAFGVGMFQGAIQALSRSYYGQIIPPDASGEYFGIYDICGKGAAFMGTMLVGAAVSITNSVNIAVATLAVLFVVGLFFFRRSAKIE
jgi:UMF1 family MFS transporter